MKHLDNPDYKGEDWNPDEELKDGPLSEDKRSCTDCFMCLIFFVFVCGLVFIGGWSWMSGDVEKLLAPTDGDGNFCGVTEAVKDYPLLYFPNLPDIGTAALFDSRVCVSACPTRNNTDSYKCHPTSKHACTSTDAYNTVPYLGRYCLYNVKNPGNELANIHLEHLKAYLQIDKGMEYLEDVGISWPAILITSVSAFICYCIFFFVLKKAASFFASLTVFGSILGMLFLTGWFWYQSFQPESQIAAVDTDTTP